MLQAGKIVPRLPPPLSVRRNPKARSRTPMLPSSPSFARRQSGKFSSKISTKDFWEESYSSSGADSKEWYGLDWRALKPVFLPYLVPQGSSKPLSEINILNVGCGNSNFSFDMHQEGFTISFSFFIIIILFIYI